MADTVQFKLERMLDELDDLERRGLFSPQEIAEIIKKHRKFEYRLKRPSPLKQDYIDYIDYEKQLDALRLIRKKSLSRKSGAKNKKKPISDYAGVARILAIYRQATTRFKGDLELWFQYLEFCKARKHGRMKQVLAQLVRFHPKEPSAWIYAASWEYNNNRNTAAARALMQNGLRACPSSEEIWVEYLRMELIHNLNAQKLALGEDSVKKHIDDKSADEKQWRDENKELFMPIEDDADKNGKLQDVESEEKLDVFRQQNMGLIEAIYEGAIKALPSAFSLRTRLFDILESTELGQAEVMRERMLSDMKSDFLEEPFYWDWLARVGVGDIKRADPKQLGKAIQVYEEGLELVRSATMVEFYVKFLMEAVCVENMDEEVEDVSFDSDGHTTSVVSHIWEVFEKAEHMDCLTEDLACQHVSFNLQLGKLDEAKMLTEKLCSEKFPDGVQLWTLRISMEINRIENESHSPSKGDLVYIFELLKNILMKVRVSDGENLWTMGLKYFVNHRHYFKKLVEISILALAKDGGSDTGFSLSSTVLNFILKRDGMESARQTYKRFLALPHPGLALFRNCIELESILASSGDKTGLANARKLYESALATYDQDDSLWRDYHSMEVKNGSSETAAAVYWRLTKAAQRQ